MSNDVKAVSDVAKELKGISDRARSLAAEMRQNIKDVTEALDVTQEVSKSLRDSGAELRGILGTQTNRPPSEDNK